MEESYELQAVNCLSSARQEPPGLREPILQEAQVLATLALMQEIRKVNMTKSERILNAS